MSARYLTPAAFVAAGIIAMKVLSILPGHKPEEALRPDVTISCANNANNESKAEPTVQPPPVHFQEQKYREEEYYEWGIITPEKKNVRHVAAKYDTISVPLIQCMPTNIFNSLFNRLPSCIVVGYQPRRQLIREAHRVIDVTPAKPGWIKKIRQVPISDMEARN